MVKAKIKVAAEECAKETGASDGKQKKKLIFGTFVHLTKFVKIKRIFCIVDFKNIYF